MEIHQLKHKNKITNGAAGDAADILSHDVSSEGVNSESKLTASMCEAVDEAL